MKIFIIKYLINHNFSYIEENALNILADFIIKYMQRLGLKSKEICERSGRSIPNIL